jgi:hypothetical protein
MHIHAAAGTGVSVMTDENAEQRLEDDQEKTDQPYAPKEVRGKRLIVPRAGNGREKAHAIKLAGSGAVAQKKSPGAIVSWHDNLLAAI